MLSLCKVGLINEEETFMDLSIAFNLMGGLGLFLYGMKLMSDSLSNVAGAKLRSILEKMTKNTFVGL